MKEKTTIMNFHYQRLSRKRLWRDFLLKMFHQKSEKLNMLTTDRVVK